VPTTAPSDIDTSIQDIWSRRVLRSHVRNGFWGPFCGPPGSGMPIIQQSELLNAPGDTLRIQVTNPLSGNGVAGDTAPLAGNEEKLTSSEVLCMPALLRNAVRSYRRAGKKSIIDLREEASLRLAEWGMDQLDRARFANFQSTAAMNGQTYTPNFKYGGAATSNATLTTAMVLTVADIRKIRALLLNQKAKPYRAQGRDWFFLVVHPFAALDLKGDAAYNTAVQNAMPRSDLNPIFTGAIAAIDGVVIYESFNVGYANGGVGGTVPIQKALAFGQEAFVEALDENVSWVEDSFDYGNEFGVAYGFASQARRALELSSIQFQTALVVPS
jgi:N4-gp56 family major capsid protein